MEVYGRFRVGTGAEFKVNPMKREYHMWLVVDNTGSLVGSYDSEFLAKNLANGFHKRDLLNLDNEMEKVLTGEE